MHAITTQRGGPDRPRSRNDRCGAYHRTLPLCPRLPTLGKWLLLILPLACSVAGDAGGVPPLPPAEAAWWQLLNSEVDEAAAAAETMLRTSPDHARVACVMAEVWNELRRTDDLSGWLGKQSSRDGITQLGMGKWFHLKQEYAPAESLLTLAADRFQQQQYSKGQQVALEQLGTLLIDLGRPREAAERLTASLALADSLRLPLAAAFCHLNLGRTLVRTQELDRSAEHLQAGLSGAERLEVPLWQGDAEIALSVIARFQMDLDRALQHRQNALAAYEAAEHLPGQARSLHYIATIHIFKGELTVAMSLLRRALAVAQEVDDPGEQSGCLGDLAGLNYLLGDLDRALAQFEEAVLMAGDSRRAGFWQTNIGSILADRGQFAEALPYLRQARETVSQVGDFRTVATVLITMGRCHCEMDEYDQGLGFLDESLAISREYQFPLNEAYTLRALGFCHLARGELPAAEAALAEASRLARQTDFFDIIEASLMGQAMVARRRGNHSQALLHLEEALQSAETVRRRSGGSPRVQSSFFGEVGDTYEVMIDLLHELHTQDPGADHDRRAYDVAQRAKARSFLDLLAEAEVDLRCRAEPRYQERELEILTRVTELEQMLADGAAEDAAAASKEISQLEEELDLLEAELRRADPRYAELRYPRPITLAAVQEKLLESDELLLEYSLGDSASYLFAVTGTSFRFLRLPDRAEIEAQVRRLLPLLNDYNVLGADPTYFVAAAEMLGTSLLAPAEAELAAAQRVIIAPSGILHYLPFEVLPVAEVAAGDLEQGFARLPYLALSADVVYVPSVSALARLRAGDAGSGAGEMIPELLLIGDPVPPTEDELSIFARAVSGPALAPLPFVTEEMTGLRQLYPDDRGVVLQGAAANLANVRQAGMNGPYRYVHFAAHGVFNEQRPQYSGLILSRDADSADDGFMTTSEVFSLELPCNQVVLSACSSALGEQVSGEGLVGLTRGFLFAGARSVVAALWDVSGQATVAFMHDFYRELALAGGRERASALAEAKRRLIRGESAFAAPGVASAHPYFWAAFVMNGDDQ